MAEFPLVCRLDRLDSKQRARHGELLAGFPSRVSHVGELEDGFLFLFPPDPALFLLLAEWITLERACCPFIHFRLEAEPGGRPVRLTLSGRAGVKQFLRSEFPSRVPACA